MAVDLSKVLTHILRTSAERKEWGLNSLDKSTRAQELYNLIAAEQEQNIQFYMRKMGMNERKKEEQKKDSTEVKDVFYTKDVVEICYLVMQLANVGLVFDPVNTSNPFPSNRPEVYLSHETKYKTKI